VAKIRVGNMYELFFVFVWLVFEDSLEVKWLLV
jgi:hypothetical protein